MNQEIELTFKDNWKPRYNKNLKIEELERSMMQ
jgi:hypothetical protein